MKRGKGKIKLKGLKIKKFRFSFFMMLMAFSIVPLVLAIVIVSCISTNLMKSNLEKSAKETLYIAANNLASHCKENNISFATSDNYNEYLDSLKEQNIEMAILLNNAPSVTSIKNESDFRIREIPFDKDVEADKEELMNGYYNNDVVIENQVYYAYYMPIITENKIIGMAFAGELQENVTRPINSTVNNIVMIAAVLIVLFAAVSFLLGKIFAKNFVVVKNRVNALAEGDLSRQPERSSGVQELYNLYIATNTMQGNLSKTIGQIKEVLEKLAVNIAEMTQSSDSSFDRAKQITSAMEELANATFSMTENVQDIQTQMLEIGNCVNDISESVGHLSNSSDNILQTNNEAKTNMNTIMENSKKSVSAVNEIASQINETNDSIKEIDAAVELILSISEQSNLLSLNASIEAARAGEAGRGFAVVADEIRKMAEQSSEGAEMIRNLAQKIVEKSQKSVQLADSVHTLILSEQEDVSRTQKKYEELSEDISRSVNEIKSISEKTENLSDYKEKVIGNVQDLSAISEENAASNEEVNANIGEIIAEVEKVNQHCESINAMANELETSIAFFRN